MPTPSLGIVGAGKVGSTLARLWHRSGCEVRAVYSPRHAPALAAEVGAAAVSSPGEVAERADLTLLTVPDDVISAVAAVLPGDLTGKGVVHTSGAHSVGILSALVERGALVGSLHPAFPFADVESAVQQLPGATFAIEAESERLRTWLLELVQMLNGRVLLLSAEQKALYHCALVFASNYTVTLYAIAERLLTMIGAETGTADQALNALVGGTLTNLRQQGIPAALTGPLVRADVGTIRAHLGALRQIDQPTADLYIQLARLSFPLLEARGLNTDLIGDALRQE